MQCYRCQRQDDLEGVGSQLCKLHEALQLFEDRALLTGWLLHGLWTNFYDEVTRAAIYASLDMFAAELNELYTLWNKSDGICKYVEDGVACGHSRDFTDGARIEVLRQIKFHQLNLGLGPDRIVLLVDPERPDIQPAIDAVQGTSSAIQSLLRSCNLSMKDGHGLVIDRNLCIFDYR